MKLFKRLLHSDTSLTKYYLQKSVDKTCSIYKPLDIVFKKAKGVYMYDLNNKKYIDFLAGYSSLNLGHSHPKIIKKAKSQLSNLNVTSRAFHNDKMIDFCAMMSRIFKYDKCLPMNTGVEAVESAIKIARKWSYEIKNIEPNKSMIAFASNNFHGRTIAAISGSSDFETKHNFGPLVQGMITVSYNNIEELEKLFKTEPNLAAYIMEPIQGEAGVIIPDPLYLRRVRDLCNQYNVLFICDEIQTGLGRTGLLLASHYENVKPDLLLLGKSLGGGIVPLSCVLGNRKVMDVLTVGTHGSTFAGNPFACTIGMESLNVLLDENLCMNSYEQGRYFRKAVKDLNIPHIKDIRGKGLMNSIQLYNNISSKMVVKKLSENGLLCKETKNNTLRLSPPLTITRNQINKAINIIHTTLSKNDF